MKKLSANIRNNFWVLNAKPISMLIGGILVILYSASIVLQLIEKLV